MQNFNTLFATINKSTNAVVLTWSLAPRGAASDATSAIRALSRDNRPNTAPTPTPIVSVAVLRSFFGDDTWTTLSTNLGSDFANSTYTDTPGTEGTYSYKLRVVSGVAGKTQTDESNVISVGTYSVTTLSGSVSGNTVSLAWTIGFGSVVSTTVERSDDAGVTYQPIKVIPGQQAVDFSEQLSVSGDFSYRVKLNVQDPERPDGLSGNTIITSNVVTFTGVVGTGQ